MRLVEEQVRERKKSTPKLCFDGAASSAKERSLILSPYSLPGKTLEKGRRIPSEKKRVRVPAILVLPYVPDIGAVFLFFFSLLAAGPANSLFSFSLFFFRQSELYRSRYDTSNMNSAVFSYCKRMPVLARYS